MAMQRRQFIGLLNSAVMASALAARAQQRERMRRIGVLMSLSADDPESPARIAAFLQGMAELGWADRRNMAIDYRWAAGDPERYRKSAAELVALSPDVILASGASSAAPLQQATRSVPIVFANASDPVANGFVASLARPGGNLTGFANFEYGTSAKWLELLKQVAPGLKRAAILRDPTLAAGIGQVAAIQAVAPSFGVELTLIDARDPIEIERAVAVFARGSGNGLITATTAPAVVHRQLIISLAARHALPAVYPYRLFVADGGLASYGPDPPLRMRSTYAAARRNESVEKPADLPVQNPTRYELVLNLKTAKAQGITIPPELFARADEVIE
jgi:putative ABC transport system substrate-binding protein